METKSEKKPRKPIDKRPWTASVIIVPKDKNSPFKEPTPFEEIDPEVWEKRRFVILCEAMASVGYGPVMPEDDTEQMKKIRA